MEQTLTWLQRLRDPPLAQHDFADDFPLRQHRDQHVDVLEAIGPGARHGGVLVLLGERGLSLRVRVPHH
jgi:hypothetical protein